MSTSATPLNPVLLLTHTATSGQNTAEFPVKGQGTVSVSPVPTSPRPFDIILTPQGQDLPALGLTVLQDEVVLWYKAATQPVVLERKPAPGIGLNPEGVNQPYWFSLDSNNRRVRYGKGEMLRTLMLFEYSWPKSLSSEANAPEALASFTKNLSRIQVQPVRVDSMEVLSVPINLDPDPHIVPSDSVTLELLSENKISVIADLPTECQQLYSNVAGAGITITPKDFPEFPAAIQHSIVTPGCLCYKELANKPKDFGYLRITIDSNLGDSPGQPYVLEIWPAGNGSPIHDHGRACAIIKVLHGQIQVSWFPALSPRIQTPWGQVTLVAGEVTFLTPDYYQIHQLHNPLPKGADFCATIQCYRYLDRDRTHYEYFDYIEDGQIKHFDPDSDWTYSEFKDLIRKEWTAARAQHA